MAVPALRQPKVLQQVSKNIENEDVQNVILTLKGNKSLVISSDAYHGILKGKEMYRCVFCRSEMEPDVKMKELHKNSSKHRMEVENYPHVGDFGDNLIRKVDKDTFYCTLCNVIVSNPFLARHISAEVHNQELEKAEMRASTYKPTY